MAAHSAMIAPACRAFEINIVLVEFIHTSAALSFMLIRDLALALRQFPAFVAVRELFTNRLRDTPNASWLRGSRKHQTSLSRTYGWHSMIIPTVEKPVARDEHDEQQADHGEKSPIFPF